MGETPFYKMKGSSALGYGNQHSKGRAVGKMYNAPNKKALVGDQDNLPEHLQAKIEAAPKYASPAKVKPPMTDEQKQKARYVELSKENEDKPGFKEARNKAFGGKTTVKGGVSTTRTTA